MFQQAAQVGQQDKSQQVPTAPDFKKDYSIPDAFEQTDVPTLSSDDPKVVINTLKPVRTIVDLSPDRGRNAIAQVTALLGSDHASVRAEAALTVEKIGARVLKDEKATKSDKDRENLRAARYHMLVGLGKQAEAEMDKAVIERIQAAANKLATPEEIAAIRKGTRELAEKLFGPAS